VGKIAGSGKMATEFCQKCKQAHPGRLCDYDEKGDCTETVDVDAISNEESKDEEDRRGVRINQT